MKSYTFTDPGADTDQGWALLAVCWALVFAAFISTALRVWVRAKITNNLGADDWVMMTAMFTTIIGVALITCEIKFGGLGRHEFYLSDAQRRDFQILGWVDWMQTIITLMLTKISICLFLLRIVDAKKMRLALWALIAFLIVFSAIILGLFLGLCRPIQAYWEVDPVDAICFSDYQLSQIVLAQGILSIITDLLCAAFPILFIRGLQVKKQTKILLCVLMGLGVITAACCTVRTAYSSAVEDPDISWAIVPNVAWRIPEVNIGIFCANAPILRPLYLFFRGRLQSQTGSKSYNSHSISKDRFVMSQNQQSGPRSTAFSGSDDHHHRGFGGVKLGSADEDVELEMGLPPQASSRH